MENISNENLTDPLIDTPSDKKKLLDKKNILVGILFIVLGIFFLVNSIIIKNPHKTSFDKKEVHSEEELKTKDTYLYEHEKGGDRKLRLTTSYILMSLVSNCVVLAIIFFIGVDNDLQFKNKGFMIAAGIFGAIFFGCIIYYLIWRSGSLNKKANDNYQKITDEKTCRAEGEGIIYDNCAIDELIEMYNTCIEPVKSRHRANCAVDLPKYFLVKNMIKNINDERSAQNPPLAPILKPDGDLLKAASLTEATFNKYNELDKSPENPLTCERYINIQVENNPMNLKCKKSTMKDFLKTDKHKECIEKSKKQSKLDVNNLYNKDTQKGTTFSNCTEKKKYFKIKSDIVEQKIKESVDGLTLASESKPNLTQFKESESGGTVTRSTVDTSGSGSTGGGNIDSSRDVKI